MTSPGPDGVARTVKPGLEDEVRQLRSELEALRQRPLRYAGEFFTESTEGVKTFFTGPYYPLPGPDGTPQWITRIRDRNDVTRMAFWDPDPNVDGYIQAEYHWDHLGQITWTTDNNGGWAEPWLGVPIYQQFPQQTGNQYAPVNGVENRMWYGRIPYISHPNLGVSGVWGPRTGTNTTRYRLKVWGNVIATWDVSGAEDSDRGPFNIATLVNDKQASIEITAQTLSGTGEFYCQVASVHLRQT